MLWPGRCGSEGTAELDRRFRRAPRMFYCARWTCGRDKDIHTPIGTIFVALTSGLDINSTKLPSGVTVMRSIAKRIACLCVLLTIWSAVAFAAHHHSSAADSTTCTVCIAAHSASPKTTTTLPRVMFVTVSTFRPEPVSARQLLTIFVLCVRPPPEV